MFTRRDAERFANTWLLKVKRPGGGWAGYVCGDGDGSEYMPSAGGMWLALCRIVPKRQAQALYQDVAQAFLKKERYSAYDLVGVARLCRYSVLA